jgi:hypothetical protein
MRWFRECCLRKRSGFINCKDVGCGYRKRGRYRAAQIAERLSAHTQEGLNNPLVAGRYRYVAVRRTFSVRARLIPPTAEFVVQGGGEHVDAAIFDSDCIGAECASGNRKALVL